MNSFPLMKYYPKEINNYRLKINSFKIIIKTSKKKEKKIKNYILKKLIKSQ